MREEINKKMIKIENGEKHLIAILIPPYPPPRKRANKINYIPFILMHKMLTPIFSLQMLKKTILLMICLSNIDLPGNKGEEEELIKVMNALNFRKLRKNYIFFTSSLPLMYKERLDLSKEDIIQYTSLAIGEGEGKCKCTEYEEEAERCNLMPDANTPIPEVCKHNNIANISKCENACDVEKMLVKIKNLLRSELTAAIFDTQIELETGVSEKRRIKRGIEFFGKIFKFCCDVTLDSQLIPLEENEHRISEVYEKLGDAVIEDHKTLFSFQTEINTIAGRTSESIIEIRRKSEIWSKRTEIKNAIAHEIELLIAHYRQLTHYCHSSHIPVNVITPQILKTDLLKVRGELEKHGKELAIGMNKIIEYYKVPIASCQILNDEIVITIKIPVIEANTKYEMFEPLAIPFVYESEICQIKIEKSVVLRETKSNELKVLTGQALEKCTRAGKLCAISKTIQDQNTMCTEKIFRGETSEKIKRACNFMCIGRLKEGKERKEEEEEEDLLPIINEIDDREFTITRPSEELAIEFQNRTIKKIGLKKGEMGAYHLKLPCTARLIKENSEKTVVLIDRKIPCFKNNEMETPKITRILPSAWVNIPDSVVEDQFQGKQGYTATDEKLLNREWKRSIPSTTIQTDLEFEKKIKHITLKELEKQNPWCCIHDDNVLTFNNDKA